MIIIVGVIFSVTSFFAGILYERRREKIKAQKFKKQILEINWNFVPLPGESTDDFVKRAIEKIKKPN